MASAASGDGADDGDYVFKGPKLVDARALDHAARCGICREIMKAAVTLELCTHSFCSACIRTSLTQTQVCPNCRQPAELSSIKANHSLQSLLAAYKKARPLLKVALLRFADADESVGAPTASSGLRSARQHSTAAHRLDSDDDIVEVLASDIPAGPSSSAGASAVRLHVKAPERLALRNYHPLKDKQLKELCRDCSLPSDGDRETLIYRHRSYVTEWNSALDGIPRYEAEPAEHAKAVAQFNKEKIVAAADRATKLWASDKVLRTSISREKPQMFDFTTSAVSGGASVFGSGTPPSGPAPVNSLARIDSSMAEGFRRLAEGAKKRKLDARVQHAAQPTSVSLSTLSASIAPALPALGTSIRAVWSEVASKPFFFDTVSGVGSFEHPDGAEATTAWQSSIGAGVTTAALGVRTRRVEGEVQTNQANCDGLRAGAAQQSPRKRPRKPAEEAESESASMHGPTDGHAETASWTCPACTLCNRNRNKRCDVCHKARP